MSEEHNLFKRDDLLECLRSTADFTPIEGEFVAQARAIILAKRWNAENDFVDALAVETAERKRQIQNNRALDKWSRTMEDPEAWR